MSTTTTGDLVDRMYLYYKPFFGSSDEAQRVVNGMLEDTAPANSSPAGRYVSIISGATRTQTVRIQTSGYIRETQPQSRSDLSTSEVSRRKTAASSDERGSRCLMSKKRKTFRGSEFSVSLPTEPLAGAAKTAPIMSVMVAEDGESILDYDLTLGSSIAFRVGGGVKAYMERVGPAPDSDIRISAVERQCRARHRRIRACSER